MASETALTYSGGNHALIVSMSYTSCQVQDGKMEGQVEVGRKGKRGMDIANTTISGERSRNRKV